MAGGSGTRFWPLSRQTKPKQFLNLSGRQETMVKETANRLLGITEHENIFVVTGQEFLDATREETENIILEDHILSEPAARNTAACIGYAAMEILKKYGDGIMCIVPSDHFIRDEQAFCDVMNQAVQVATETDKLVTIGIRPTFPATGYGYICCNREKTASFYKIEEFVEKPDLSRAREYVASGFYSWNSGMFIWKASTILDYFQRLLPDIYEPLQKIGEAMMTDRERTVINEIYPDIPRISIDYGIMERVSDALMLEGDFGWNDIGTFDSLGDIFPKDENGNVKVGTTLSIDSRNCIFYGQDDKLVAALGVKDLIIAQTDDVILVCDRSRAQDIRQFTEALQQEGMEHFL